MSDQKINVDININADSLNQVPQYKAAFELLLTTQGTTLCNKKSLYLLQVSDI